MKKRIYSVIICIALAIGITACGASQQSATLSAEQRLVALRGAYYAEVQELKDRGFSDAEIDAMLTSGMVEEALGISVASEDVPDEEKPTIEGYVVTIESKNNSYIKFTLDSNMHITTTESGTTENQDMMSDALWFQDSITVDKVVFGDVDVSRCNPKFVFMLSVCNDFISKTAMKASSHNPEDFVIDVQGEIQEQKEALDEILFDIVYENYCKWNHFDETPVTAKINGYVWDVKAMADSGRNSYRIPSEKEIADQQKAIAEAEKKAEEERIAEEKRLEQERLEQERKEAEAAAKAEEEKLASIYGVTVTKTKADFDSMKGYVYCKVTESHNPNVKVGDEICVTFLLPGGWNFGYEDDPCGPYADSQGDFMRHNFDNGYETNYTIGLKPHTCSRNKGTYYVTTDNIPVPQMYGGKG